MPSIRQDVFPATVVFTNADFEVPVEELRSSPPTPGAAAMNTTRVIVTSDRIIIAKDGGSQGPTVIFNQEIDPAFHFKSHTPNSLDSYVVTKNGAKVAFRKDSACGCGSRLKSWRPFGGTSSSIKDPTE